MDGYVLDLPPLLRWLVVRMLILPFRPQRTAQAYARIWDAAGAGTGSPLLHNSRRCRERLGQFVDFPVALAMRYGNPGIAAAMADLAGAGADDILLIPMYPQHADSTRTTSIAAGPGGIARGRHPLRLPAFYDMLPYVEAQAAVIARNLPEHWDHLLFSYHGLPERHVRRADPSGAHCLASGNCCEEPSAAHATCYRHQAYRTAALLAQRLRIGPQRYSVSFQSRLGRAPWLKPYTDQQLRTPAGPRRSRSGGCLPRVHRGQPGNPGRDRHRRPGHVSRRGRLVLYAGALHERGTRVDRGAQALLHVGGFSRRNCLTRQGGQVFACAMAVQRPNGS